MDGGTIPRTLAEVALMIRFALIATILVVAAGCDKTKGMLGLGQPPEPDGPPPEARLNLARRPDVLFQLFGERDDARMVPVAAIIDGALKPIELTESGWREFDAMYTRSNRSYPLYRDGAAIGEVRVRRGMWERRDQPLYTLPGCRLVTPLSAVSLETSAIELHRGGARGHAGHPRRTESTGEADERVGGSRAACGVRGGAERRHRHRVALVHRIPCCGHQHRGNERPDARRVVSRPRVQ